MRRRARIAVGESQRGATGQLQFNVCAGNVGRCKRTEANSGGGDEGASERERWWPARGAEGACPCRMIVARGRRVEAGLPGALFLLVATAIQQRAHWQRMRVSVASAIVHGERLDHDVSRQDKSWSPVSGAAVHGRARRPRWRHSTWPRWTASGHANRLHDARPQ